MNRVALFMTATIVGGVGGFIGSVAGGAFGSGALFVGGYIGGIAIAPLTGWMAARRGWVDSSQRWPATIGAAAGFILAATLAINTLSSPIGPVIATTLTGLGAVLGATRATTSNIRRGGE